MTRTSANLGSNDSAEAEDRLFSSSEPKTRAPDLVQTRHTDSVLFNLADVSANAVAESTNAAPRLAIRTAGSATNSGLIDLAAIRAERARDAATPPPSPTKALPLVAPPALPAPRPIIERSSSGALRTSLIVTALALVGAAIAIVLVNGFG